MQFLNREVNRLKFLILAPLNPRKILTKVQAKCLKSYISFYEDGRQVAVYQVLKQKKEFQEALCQIESELFPDPSVLRSDDELQDPHSIFPSVAGQQVLPSFYSQYACQDGCPLHCSMSRSQTVDLRSMEDSRCGTCQFPMPLAEKVQIRTARGTYKLGEYVGVRGFGRLYWATQAETQQRLVIKEYLLPARYFNRAERTQRQKALTQLAGLSWLGSPGKDFQILTPIEVLAEGPDERCYVMFDERSANPTLNQVLKHTGAWSFDAVHRLLNQLLQILEVLHGQKFQLSTGQIYADLTHGNLTLDTVLLQGITLDETPRLDPSFYLYLCDLALWEGICRTPLMQLPDSAIDQELRNVGYLAFYALHGGAAARNGLALDPTVPEHWPTVSLGLKTIVRRLLGLEEPFGSAMEARQALLQIDQGAPPRVQEYEEAPPLKPQRNWWKYLAFGVGAIAIGTMVTQSLKPKPATLLVIPVREKIKEVGPLPAGEFRYTAVKQGTWHYLLHTASLIESGQTLEGKLKAAQPALALKFEPSDSLEAAFNSVRSGRSAFTVAPLTQTLPEDLESQTIAYDGLAVFVPFSYANREQGLPHALTGAIGWEQLQMIYRGDVQNWNALSQSNLPLKRYQADNLEYTAVFEQKLLGITNPAESPLMQVARTPNFFELLRSVLRDFESNQTGSIGFAPWSRVVGQCSVYPLAIHPPSQPTNHLGVSIPTWLPVQTEPPIQPLVWQDGETITPMSNLCDRKGSYRLNDHAFQSGQYPLSYPIAVIYAKRNDRPPIGIKFAEMLRTKEGQQLLKQAGLVPAIVE